MNMSDLIGKVIQIGDNDVSKVSLLARTIAVEPNGSAAVLKLSQTIHSSRAAILSYAVVNVRHEGHSLSELFEGKNVVCGITFVSEDRFSKENPFDLSWWRGGNAAIASVSLASAMP